MRTGSIIGCYNGTSAHRPKQPGNRKMRVLINRELGHLKEIRSNLPRQMQLHRNFLSAFVADINVPNPWAEVPFMKSLKDMIRK